MGQFTAKCFIKSSAKCFNSLNKIPISLCHLVVAMLLLYVTKVLEYCNNRVYKKQ